MATIETNQPKQFGEFTPIAGRTRVVLYEKGYLHIPTHSEQMATLDRSGLRGLSRREAFPILMGDSILLNAMKGKGFPLASNEHQIEYGVGKVIFSAVDEKGELIKKANSTTEEHLICMIGGGSKSEEFLGVYDDRYAESLKRRYLLLVGFGAYGGRDDPTIETLIGVPKEMTTEKLFELLRA